MPKVAQQLQDSHSFEEEKLRENLPFVAGVPDAIPETASMLNCLGSDAIALASNASDVSEAYTQFEPVEVDFACDVLDHSSGIATGTPVMASSIFNR
jgi:hypothetical protein